MRFSNVVDYKGQPHFVCKTGRKNIRILKPGQPYEKSFVVPLKRVSNRRPAEYEEPEDEDQDDVELDEGKEPSSELPEYLFDEIAPEEPEESEDEEDEESELTPQ